MSNTLIPFGKYKGKELDDISEDTKYIGWLIKKDWFKERHQNIYKIIINNFSSDDETPEHNLIQSYFLRDDICKHLIEIATGKKMLDLYAVEFEVSGIDVDIYFQGKGFESDGQEFHEQSHLSIEIKPTVSDEYPSILRQIKKFPNTSYGPQYKCLLLRDFSSESIDLSQLTDFFKRSDIAVIQLHDNENISFTKINTPSCQ